MAAKRDLGRLVKLRNGRYQSECETYVLGRQVVHLARDSERSACVHGPKQEHICSAAQIGESSVAFANVCDTLFLPHYDLTPLCGSLAQQLLGHEFGTRSERR
jgi:hypothetical protein